MSDNCKIKAVIFDLYGTLIEIKEKRYPYQNLVAEIGLSLEEKISAYGTILKGDHQSLKELAYKIKPTRKIDTRRYESMLSKELNSVEIYDDVKETLKELKSSGIRLGLISNLATPYKKPFYNLGLDKYIDEALFSCEEGIRKPDIEIYKRMARRLGALPSETIMAGDSLKNDVIGAHEAGLNAIYLDRENKEKKYLNYKRISSLTEIFHFI